MYATNVADLYRRASSPKRFAKPVWPLALAATLALMGYGLAGLGTLELVPVSGFGITRYVSAATGPPVIGVAVAGAALAAGAAIWRACRWPWLAWTALAMLIGSGASAAHGRDVLSLVTNAAELLLLAAVLACAWHLHLGYVMPRHRNMARRF